MSVGNDRSLAPGLRRVSAALHANALPYAWFVRPLIHAVSKQGSVQIFSVPENDHRVRSVGEAVSSVDDFLRQRARLRWSE